MTPAGMMSDSFVGLILQIVDSSQHPQVVLCVQIEL